MATLTKKDLLKEYIRRDFYWSNIDKYRKYFDKWYDNLTEIQLEFWQKKNGGTNMLTEKDYCDYDTCVALKELGYDDSTDLRYNSYGSLGDFLGGIKAPTLYEAQKWLREEKKTEIVVLGQNYIDGPYYPDIYTEDGLMNNAKDYKTYEEALSEGIKEAVKILKEIGNGE